MKRRLHNKAASLAAGFIAMSIVAVIFATAVFCAAASAQSSLATPSGPTGALTSALSAACRENSADFSNYLTDANAAAFRNLPSDDRISMMKRFVLLDTNGRPLLSNNLQGKQYFICGGADASQKFTLGAARVHDHLAYVPVTTSGGDTIQFGLVSEDGNWKLLSVGLLLIDIPQLQKEWAARGLKDREQSAVETLRGLEQAVKRYEDAFGKLPQNLAQLGPPTQGGVSPDAAKLIDSALASGVYDGYEFRYREVTSAGLDARGFEIAAVPQKYGKTGKFSFLLDKNGHIHGADKKGGVATIDDDLIPNQDSGTS